MREEVSGNKMQKVLFLCTGNSCRSIMAEAIANGLGEGKILARSAGSQPTGFAHPKALSTLDKHGFETTGFSSKSWDVFAEESFDVVITVCDSAASEQCPAFVGDVVKLHWSIADPAGVVGTDEEIEQAFEAAFAELRHRIAGQFLS